jgi:hypothetical protein
MFRLIIRSNEQSGGHIVMGLFLRASDLWTSSSRSAISAFAVAMLCSACSSAPSHGWTPIQGAIFDSVQIFSEDTDVYGLKVNVPYGRTTSMYGIDAGLVGFVGTLDGMQLNWFWSEAQDINGIQFGGLPGNRAVNLNGLEIGAVNIVEGRVNGVQLAPVMNEADHLVGVQFAGISNRSQQVLGIQIAPLVNDAESLTGVQVGIMNFAPRATGVQIGALVNKADSVAGLQIGLLNINKNGWLPFFPILNFGFGHAQEEATTSED